MASTTTASEAGSPGLADRLEALAWRIQQPSRRLFTITAAVVAAACVLAGLAGAQVAADRGSTLRTARRQGLTIATDATSFRTSLVEADTAASETLLAGGLESPTVRGGYETALLAASSALTHAAAVASDDDQATIGRLSSGLVAYAGLVESARANSRQGFPVGSAYLAQAHALARDELSPLAEQLRRTGEQRLARAANHAGGPAGAIVLALLLIAVLAAVAGAALVAGRTRRLSHPAYAVGFVTLLALLVTMGLGVSRQAGQLRTAAGRDIGRVVALSDNRSTLAGIRITELEAVAARGNGAARYADIDAKLVTAVDTISTAGGADVAAAAVRWGDAVRAVEAADRAGRNRDAATLALGESRTAYDDLRARLAASSTTAQQQLATRIADADLGFGPLRPLLFGLIAAVLCAVGVLARARRYR